MGPLAGLGPHRWEWLCQQGCVPCEVWGDTCGVAALVNLGPEWRLCPGDGSVLADNEVCAWWDFWGVGGAVLVIGAAVIGICAGFG